jgi:hypothetical protein
MRQATGSSPPRTRHEVLATPLRRMLTDVDRAESGSIILCTFTRKYRSENEHQWKPRPAELSFSSKGQHTVCCCTLGIDAGSTISFASQHCTVALRGYMCGGCAADSLPRQERTQPASSEAILPSAFTGTVQRVRSSAQWSDHIDASRTDSNTATYRGVAVV